MTNEQLAARAKAGDRAALAQLWEQNRGLLTNLFSELARKAGARMAAMGVTWEDVEQSFFLAVALAVRLYEPERGALFSSFLSYPVKAVFFDLIGWRTEHQRRDPLGLCTSLDEPISGEDGSQTPRGELVPDPAAGQQFEGAEERIYTEQLHKELEACLATLEPNEEKVIRFRYYENMSSSHIGTRLGYDAREVRRLEQRAMRNLRHPRNSGRLKQYCRQHAIVDGAYHGTGWAAWNRGGSVEERTVIWLEDKGLI